MAITRRHVDQRDSANAETRALLEGQRKRRVDEIVQLEVHLQSMRAAMARASAAGSFTAPGARPLVEWRSAFAEGPRSRGYGRKQSEPPPEGRQVSRRGLCGRRW